MRMCVFENFNGNFLKKSDQRLINYYVYYIHIKIYDYRSIDIQNSILIEEINITVE